MGWQGPPQSPSSYIVKKILRLEVPTHTYPNVCFHLSYLQGFLVQHYGTITYTTSRFVQFNFIGRLLGPRGNSLKRIEASTGCRVFIRGKGSIKDSGKVSITLESTRYGYVYCILKWLDDCLCFVFTVGIYFQIASSKPSILTMLLFSFRNKGGTT